MKLFVFLAIVAIIGYAAAAPQGPEVQVLKSTNDINEDGSFSYVLELSDGTFVSQNGRIKNPQETDPEKKILLVEGEYRFTDAKSGETVNVKYVADENGYQPTLSRRK
ncbi:unnamed protein product [Allacma fusca]|uniref:Uncharacterized protein n=1 Tax=Allacma fusca TaxID=39272 RepID=A0A8J2JNF9_9HEXA|nr:unnamed protein product [Allacma fusca]